MDRGAEEEESHHDSGATVRWPLALLALSSACGGAAPPAPSTPVPAPARTATAEENPEIAACDAAAHALDSVAAEDSLQSAFQSTSGTVASINVEADSPELAARAKPLVQLAPGAKLGDSAVRSDVQRLWQLGGLQDVQVRTSGPRDALVVSYLIQSAPTIRSTFHRGEGADEPKVAEELGLVPGKPYEHGAVASGLSRLKEGLVEEGYRDATVTLTGKRLDGGRVDVCIHLDRGNRLLLRGVSISGNSKVPTRDLEALLSGKPGQPLNDLALERDVLKMQALYYDQGFLMSKIHPPKIQVVNGALDVRITIEEGPVFNIGSIGVKRGSGDD